MDEEELIWQVDDGYVGGRPQYTYIDIDTFARDYDSEEEVREAIDDIVEDQFRQDIGWYAENMDKIVAKIVAKIAELKADDKDEGEAG
jgi:hypothetical protein